MKTDGLFPCRSCIAILFSSMAVLVQAAELVSIPSSGALPIKAWHYRPQGSLLEPRPVVVALHGCTGLYSTSGSRKGLLNLRHHEMGENLARQGYHAVFPDSFGSRGIESICSEAQRSANSVRVSIGDRRADVLAALNWVRTQPWAELKRNNIAVLGWSHGAITVLSATDASHPAVKAAGQGFKLAIAFYPGCIQAQRTGYTPNTPLTLLLGAADDWTLPGPCVAMAEDLTAKGFQIRFKLYPDAVHGFDWPLAGVSTRDDIPSQSPARKGLGVMYGQNPQAREDSWRLVRETLARAFAAP
jgi:dienelactone hydrolase